MIGEKRAQDVCFDASSEEMLRELRLNCGVVVVSERCGSWRRLSGGEKENCLLKKNSVFKCYLSMSLDYNEDPHWYGVIGSSHGGWRSSVCWAMGWKKFLMSGVAIKACRFSALSCWVKYRYPRITHCCRRGSGKSRIC